MKVLELFAGSRSIGKAAEAREHQVFSSDIEAFEKIDYVVDILEIDLKKIPFIPDMVWASSPCTAFSVASMGKHWTGGKKAYIPKTETAKLGMALAQKSIEIIEYYKKINPNLIWYMENPRGVLRHMPFMKILPIMHTITYCKYGDIRMKPTDIWTNNDYWMPRTMCKNNGFGLKELNGENWALNQVGKPCHVAAPRGAKTGTQGLKGDYFRSMLPEELCEEIIKATELCINKKHAGFLYDPVKYCRYCYYEIEPSDHCKCQQIHDGTHCIICGTDHDKNGQCECVEITHNNQIES